MYIYNICIYSCIYILWNTLNTYIHSTILSMVLQVLCGNHLPQACMCSIVALWWASLGTIPHHGFGRGAAQIAEHKAPMAVKMNVSWRVGGWWIQIKGHWPAGLCNRSISILLSTWFGDNMIRCLSHKTMSVGLDKVPWCQLPIICTPNSH